MSQPCRGCGRPVDPVRIFCSYCGRRLPQPPRAPRTRITRPFLVPLGLLGFAVGGATGYFARPAALGGRASAWNLSPGVFDQLLSATAHGAFLRALLFAALGLAAGLAAGWLIQRRAD